MKPDESGKKAGVTDDLPPYMAASTAALRKEKKFAAVHNCRSTLRSFALFWSGKKAEKAEMPMHEVFTPECLKEYETWLFAHRYSPNTVSTYMRALQAVYRRWMPPGTEGHNPVLFKNVHTRVEARTKRALTAPQMEKLMGTDAGTLPPEQQRTLACFLLMFMLRGMPFIDLYHLRKGDLRDGRITYRRHKTGVLMVVDVPPEALRLIQKHRNRTESDYLFPLLDDGKEDGLHSHGVPDAEELDRRYQQVLRRFNRELERLMKRLLPGVKVSSYTARHTWATIAYHIGVSVGLISESMGHSSIQVTMTYLKPFDAEVIDKVNRQVISSVRKCRKRKDDRYNRLYGIDLR